MAANQPRTNDFPDYLKIENQTATEENIALFKASLAGSITAVRAVLAKGGKPNFFHRPEDLKNSLHVAAENGYSEIVDELLAHGAIVDCIASTSQSTSLLLAATSDHIAVVISLIKAGADVNASNCYGNTALHEACRRGSADVAELLLKHNALATAANKKGSTPLHFLGYGESADSDPISLARKLIDAGADVNARDSRGVTPLLTCCSNGRLDLIKFLIENGADPTAIDDARQDAHATAVFYKHKDVEEYFNHDSPFKRFGVALSSNSNNSSPSKRGQAEGKQAGEKREEPSTGGK